MNKRLLLVLAVVSTMGFAMPAMAAPVIVSKTQLAIPVAKASIVNRFYALLYPDKAASSIKPFTVSFIEEMPCGDTTYRLWVVEKNLKTPMVYMRQQGSYHSVGLVYQSVRNGSSKWATATTGNYSIPTILGCNGRNVVITIYSEPGRGTYETSFEHFSTIGAWKKVTDSVFGLEQVEGIIQQAGQLYIQNWCTTDGCTNRVLYGSSKTLVVNKGSIQAYNPPHYRNLTDPSIFLGSEGGSFLKVSLYRVSDGFLAVETIGRNVYDDVCGCYSQSNLNPEINVYRIHDGENAYTKIAIAAATPAELTLSAILPTMKIRIFDAHGLVLANQTESFGGYSSVAPYTDKVLIHGYSYTLEHPVIQGNVHILWETSQEFAVRYLINFSTGGPQYWQAIIQK